MAQYSRKYDFRSGTTIIADQLDEELDAIKSVLNSQIDNENIVAGAVTVDKMATPINPEIRHQETLSDFVNTGMTITPTSGWTNLLADLTSGIAYISGKRVATATTSNHPYAASKDTYVRVDQYGNINYDAVNNGATTPALPANNIWVAVVKTDATKITGYLTGRILNGAVDGAGLTVARPINISANNPYRFLASGQNPDVQPISGGGTFYPQFDNKIFDPNNNYNTSTYSYTCPVNGFYQFNMMARIDSAGAHHQLYLILPNYTYKLFAHDTNNASQIVMPGAIQVYCRAGDTAKCGVYSSGGNHNIMKGGDGRIGGYLVGQ